MNTSNHPTIAPITTASPGDPEREREGGRREKEREGGSEGGRKERRESTQTQEVEVAKVLLER